MNHHHFHVCINNNGKVIFKIKTLVKRATPHVKLV